MAKWILPQIILMHESADWAIAMKGDKFAFVDERDIRKQFAGVTWGAFSTAATAYAWMSIEDTDLLERVDAIRSKRWKKKGV